MPILRSYKKNIVEGRGFIVFSIIFALIARTVFFLFFDDLSALKSHSFEGYLWKPISSFFENPAVSLLSSSVCVILFAIMLAHINTKYVLIRRKTSLHIAICALLFSCHPMMIFMNASYISVLFVLAAVSTMFGAYSTNRKAKSALEVNFILALGSLFSPSILFFFPAFWIGLGIVRSFDFKSLLASLFSVFCVYIPVFTYYFFIGQTKNFILPFKEIGAELFSYLPIVNFGHIGWGLLCFAIPLLGVMLFHKYMTSYKDKIRVRALVSTLYLLTIFSLAALLLINIDFASTLYILLVTGTFVLTHFFALTDEKWIVYLFYLSLIVFFLYISLTFTNTI